MKLEDTKNMSRDELIQEGHKLLDKIEDQIASLADAIKNDERVVSITDRVKAKIDEVKSK
jgi:hypothetical protein